MEKLIKILLVDDEAVTREMYAEVFKKNGFEVLEAVDGLEGLDKAIKNVPDVIFTGIIMPRMDGFALFEALRKNMVTSSIPVIISSHMGREEDRKKAMELGANDFIARDIITPNEAVGKVKAVLNMVEYRLKFSPTELDANRLAQDLHFNEKLQCNDCGGEAIIVAKLKDVQAHEFSAKIVCGKCGKAQK